MFRETDWSICSVPPVGSGQYLGVRTKGLLIGDWGELMDLNAKDSKRGRGWEEIKQYEAALKVQYNGRYLYSNLCLSETRCIVDVAYLKVEEYPFQTTSHPPFDGGTTRVYTFLFEFFLFKHRLSFQFLPHQSIFDPPHRLTQSLTFPSNRESSFSPSNVRSYSTHLDLRKKSA